MKESLFLYLYNIMSWVVHDVLEFLYVVDWNTPINVGYLICIRVVFIEIAACEKMIEVENSLQPLSAVVAHSDMTLERNDIKLFTVFG